MTRAKISQYSATANDNTDVNGVNIAEGCPPSSMNNMGREIMAALKRFQVGSDGDGVTVGGSLVVAGDITVNSQGDVRFADSDSSNYVAFQAPATIATNVTFTLPAADGTSGQVIQTNGSGTLSFATPSSLTGTTDSATPFETSLGSGAGGSSTGVNNTFIGFEAGNDNTTGADNTAVGYQALDANTTGVKNTAVGVAALGVNSTGTNNTAIGYNALDANTTGIINTAVGSLALTANTTGSYNTAMGFAALEANTTASNNTAYGYAALGANTTGANNTAVGYGALDALTTATRATAVGANAGGALTTAGQFVGVGFNAGAACTTGGENTLVGDSAGGGVTTGDSNVMIGTQAGEYTTATTTGSRNIFIGAYAHSSGATVSDETVIGRNKAGKGADTGFIGSGGGVFQGNNSSSWSTTSDQRIKKNIVENTEGLEIIGQLRVCNFEYRLPEEITDLPEHAAVKKTGVQLGVIAQELQQVCPHCVTEQSTGVLSVDTDEIFWHMVNAIKELKAEVDALKSQINGA